MAGLVIGRVGWKSQATREGHRTHSITWLVGSLVTDGPFDIYFASGLPSVGSAWVYGNTNDPWAFCEPDWSVNPVIGDEPFDLWTVEQKFSTRPKTRCQDESIEDPLAEPDRISGSFVKYTKEATKDQNGDRILNSSHQPIRGKLVERDYNRPTVRIERNVATLPLTLFSAMVDTLNDAVLWGLAARKVKLSNVTWSRKIYGVCDYYYTVGYDFDIDFDTFDRLALDEGTAILSEGGDANNPEDFEIYKDQKGEPMDVILDGSGSAWDGTGSPGEIGIELYGESNLLLLGIPTSL